MVQVRVENALGAIFLSLLISIYCEDDATKKLNPYLLSYVSTILKALGPNVNVLDTTPPGPLTPPTSHLTGKLQLSKPSIEKARYYCLFAFAAYCPASSLQNYTCTFCNATGSDVRIVKVIQNSVYRTQAFITKSDKRQEIVVAFRGSANLPNFAEDFLLLVPVDIGNADIYVHQGFLAATQSLYQSVVHTVKSLIKTYPNYKITVVGHSLGGAEAILTTYFFTSRGEFPQSNRLSLYTYGQPRVGNKAFVDYMNSLDISAVRVVNRADIVPHLPPAFMGYLQTQNELFLNNGAMNYCDSTVYEDSKCSNSYGPLYTPVDHTYYFELQSITCFEDPARFILQLIIPLQKFIPLPNLLIYKPILNGLLVHLEHVLG